MKRNYYSLIVLVVAICIFTAIFSGCAGVARNGQPLQQPGDPRMQQNIQGVNPPGAAPVDPNVQNPGATGRGAGGIGMPGARQGGQQIQMQQTANERQKADNIENQLEQMTEVERVSVAVHGNRAVVGCIPENEQVDINQLKAMVEARVKEIDQTITNVSVTESPEMLREVDKFDHDMVNRPMNEVENQFNQLVQRITPQQGR